MAMSDAVNIKYYQGTDPNCYWVWMNNPSRHPNEYDEEEDKDGLGTGKYMVYKS
jgi:hypothetical protein